MISFAFTTELKWDACSQTFLPPLHLLSRSRLNPGFSVQGECRVFSGQRGDDLGWLASKLQTAQSLLALHWYRRSLRSTVDPYTRRSLLTVLLPRPSLACTLESMRNWSMAFALASCQIVKFTAILLKELKTMFPGLTVFHIQLMLPALKPRVVFWQTLRTSFSLRRMSLTRKGLTYNMCGSLRKES